LAASISRPREADLAPWLMDFHFGRFHQLATRSRLGPEADGFADGLIPSVATRKLSSYRS